MRKSVKYGCCIFEILYIIFGYFTLGYIIQYIIPEIFLRRWGKNYYFENVNILKYINNVNRERIFTLHHSPARWLSSLRRSLVHSLMNARHCVLRNWDRIPVRAVKGLIFRAGIVSICPLL